MVHLEVALMWILCVIFLVKLFIIINLFFFFFFFLKNTHEVMHLNPSGKIVRLA